MRMTKTEKETVAKGLSGSRLVELFMSYYSNMDDFGNDMYETFDVLKTEITRRCENCVV